MSNSPAGLIDEPEASPPLLRVGGIHKRFPGVHALRGVDLEVRRGEIHALVGENGAGKSTLVHVLAGVHRPDAGTIDLDGREGVSIKGERAAQAMGIAIVFQERSLFGPLGVAENVFAGRQPVGRWGRIDRRRLREEAGHLLERVGLHVAPDAPLSSLSAAEQQLVEVAKALSLRAKLIILDEPTAALTIRETETLFEVVARLKRQGLGIIYISHRLEEIFAIGDRVTVLKDGAGQGTFRVTDVAPDDLVYRMVGRPLQRHRGPASCDVAVGPVVLEVRDLRDVAPAGESRAKLRGISLSARAGEILVLAGLVGSGRTELAMALFGARPGVSGEVLIEGRRGLPRSPARAIAAGIGYLPEDRKEAGLFPEMSIAHNVAAAALGQFGSWRIDGRAYRAAVEEYRLRLRIACPGVDEPVRNLSGGNQQKVILARWLLARPRILIVDEPTRGVDVGAKQEIHDLLREQARRGTAVIVISSDLPEVLTLADRIVVLREGRVAGTLAGPAATEEQVMRLASMEVAG
jgi:ABC-type sugar transport system ATPase subunit